MAKEVRNSKGVKSSRDTAHAKSAKKSSGSRQQETKGHKMSAKKKAAKRRNRIILFAFEIVVLVVMLFVLKGIMTGTKEIGRASCRERV